MNEQRNIKLILAYDGTRYAGWQKQRNTPTIQGVLEQALALMTGGRVTLYGAGRTDAGVHALGMAANFTTTSNIPCTGFLKGLNSMIPSDIRILDAVEALPEFHARRSACAKTYVYNISNATVQLPTERLYNAHIPGNLDMRAINVCLEYIRGTHDFSSFEAAGSRENNDGGRGAFRKILAAYAVHQEAPGKIRIIITGEGFLRYMVRNIVGTLIEAGRRKITTGEFAEILAAKDRSCAGPTAPAQGLFLKEVHYRPLNAFDLQQ